MATAALAAIVAPTKQQLVDYQNACAKVNLYAYAITQTSLPVLTSPPKDYSDYVAKFAPAKAHCLAWSSSIFPTMLAFPQTIAGLTNSMFNLEETAIGQALALLKQDPNNQQAKFVLGQALTGLQTIIQAQITTAEGLLAQLNTFSTNVGADAATLASMAAQALAMAGADQTTIDGINTHIDNLNKEISTLNTWLTVSEIGIGLSIFVGLIGAVVCLIPGAQVAGGVIIGIAVLGVAGSIAGTVITNKLISADQDSITSLRQQVTGLKQDIIALQATNKQFVWLQQANKDAQAAMQAVINMWKQLDVELNSTKTDLTDVNADVSAAQYAQAEQDLKKLHDDWQVVVDFANKLKNIDYKFQDQQGNWHSFSDLSTPVKADGSTVTPIKAAA